ncbi:hypothetical protein TWF730_000509 [Orbilia blumenaviensis]|uniref:Uncharacterized protein n=1 Tax=Orbilia blumenaviensis TaxID=1796055 RepID=A0AAV9VMU5_9PEZI
MKPKSLIRILYRTTMFNNVTTLRIGQFAFEPSVGSIVKLIQRFPHIRDLSLPITVALIRKRKFETAVLALDRLKSLTFEILWPKVFYRNMTLSTVWKTIDNNASSLGSLRLNFCQEVDDRGMMIHGLIDRVRVMKRFMKVTTDHRRYCDFFPLHRTQNWPKQLYLRVLQLQRFPYCSNPEVYTNPGLFRPETLEIVSLLDCDGACEMLNKIAKLLLSLRYLQIVEAGAGGRVLGQALRQLPKPLTALYIRIGINLTAPCNFQGQIHAHQTNTQGEFSLLFASINRHSHSLRSLVLDTDRRPPVCLDLMEEDAIRLPPRSMDEINFTGWTNLEELELSVGRIQGLDYLALPPTMKFLYIGDYKTNENMLPPLRTRIYLDCLQEYVENQHSLSAEPNFSLRAVIVRLESHPPERLFFAVDRVELLKEEVGGPSMKLISQQEFERMFPEATDGGYWHSGNYKWKWVDRHIHKSRH